MQAKASEGRLIVMESLQVPDRKTVILCLLLDEDLGFCFCPAFDPLRKPLTASLTCHAAAHNTPYCLSAAESTSAGCAESPGRGT